MEAVLDQPVLVLNRLWQAVNIIGARRAFALLAREHAQVVHQTERVEQVQPQRVDDPRI